MLKTGVFLMVLAFAIAGPGDARAQGTDGGEAAPGGPVSAGPSAAAVTGVEADTGVAVDTPAGKERRAVLAELEGLRAEVARLRVLKEAQQALFQWNKLRKASGLGPAALDNGLCEGLGAWCEVLPATFGRTAGARK